MNSDIYHLNIFIHQLFALHQITAHQFVKSEQLFKIIFHVDETSQIFVQFKYNLTQLEFAMTHTLYQVFIDKSAVHRGVA